MFKRILAKKTCCGLAWGGRGERQLHPAEQWASVHVHSSICATGRYMHPPLAQMEHGPRCRELCACAHLPAISTAQCS